MLYASLPAKVLKELAPMIDYEFAILEDENHRLRSENKLLRESKEPH